MNRTACVLQSIQAGGCFSFRICARTWG
jgi:hypothetical protein